MINLPWIVGAVLFIVWFAVFESLAFKYPNRFNTLSRFVATLGAKWPLSIYLAGFLSGALAVHFYWAWTTSPLANGIG